jgi:hypothetical protein
MGKIKEITINDFRLGMSNDPRSKDTRKFYHSKHFDALTFPHKLVPRFELVDKDDSPLTPGTLYAFEYAKDDTGVAKVWVAMTRTSDNKITLWKYDSDSGLWEIPDNSLFGTTSADQNIFKKYYDGTDTYFYLADGTRYIMRVKADESEAVQNTYFDLTSYSNSAQPLHCKIDDNLYFFFDNKVYKKDEDGVPVLALTLPENGHTLNACEYGDYIAIAFRYDDDIKSTVFFWDRNDAETTLSRRFEFPSSIVYHIAVLDGRLMTVDTDYVKTYVRRYNGSEFDKLNELNIKRTSEKTLVTNGINQYDMVYDNRLYFPLDFDIEDNNDRLGIWVVDSNGRITLDQTVEGATSYRGIFNALGNFWVCHSGEKGVAKSGITFSTTNPSVYESLFIGDGDTNKKLLSVGVETEPLPTAGQVVLKYRTEIDSAWTTIFTHATDDSQYHDAVNIEATGVDLPQFREMQFRIESTGGAIPTGLNIKYEEVDDNLN